MTCPVKNVLIAQPLIKLHIFYPKRKKKKKRDMEESNHDSLTLFYVNILIGFKVRSWNNTVFLVF